ncbi:MAG: tetratricopeptide repeat protein [Bdellovibrionales bacterium]|nr:tetratricopeptide repeat protein [Bdellovibrionales bacterium]
MTKKTIPEKEERDPLALFIKKSSFLTQKYFKSVLIIVISGLLVFGVFLFYFYWQKKENKKASEFLYQARKELILAEQKAGGDIMSIDSGKNFFGQTKKAEYSTEMDQSARKYISVIKKWISKPTGQSAGIEMAHFLYQYEKKEEALNLLNAAKPYVKRNLIGFMIHFQLGTYLMDKNKYEDAIKSFQFIVNEKKAKWLWPEALLKIALCYEKQNKKNQAAETYKKIKDRFLDTKAGDKAIRYLNLLKVQNKIKKPVNTREENTNLTKESEPQKEIKENDNKVNQNSGE